MNKLVVWGGMGSVHIHKTMFAIDSTFISRPDVVLKNDWNI